MANDMTPNPTRWWLLWLFATIVLPVASGWLCILLDNWLPIDVITALLILLFVAVLSVWLLCLASIKATAPRKGALLALLIIGGLALQISTGIVGCLVGIPH
jgi:heme A synthase